MLRAFSMDTSMSGLRKALTTASSARSSPRPSPSAIIDTPPFFMVVLTSAKSRFTSPGFEISSAIPLTARTRTSSATMNASGSERSGAISRSFSLGMAMSVSTCSMSAFSPRVAFFFLVAPSTSNGKQTIATVKAPFSFAALAT